MAPKKIKEKPIPAPCVCGKVAATVKTRAGRMISCPDPMRCTANLRTLWHKGEESAIAEWNSLVQEERYRRTHEART